MPLEPKVTVPRPTNAGSRAGGAFVVLIDDTSMPPWNTPEVPPKSITPSNAVSESVNPTEGESCSATVASG